jgi:2-haloacid dehalogenase
VTELNIIMPTVPRLILFDVFGTLLEMNKIRYRINEALQSRRAYPIWSELSTQYACVDIITGDFHSFDELSKEALQRTSEILGQPLNDQLHDEIDTLMRHAPVHEDVQKGLSRLRDAGFQLAVLSNSSANVLRDRMESTGLISYFEYTLTSEDVRQYKPAREAYEAAIKRSELQPHEILMATSHWWDLRGANSAGLQTAFIQRNNSRKGSFSPTASFTVTSLVDLSEALTGAVDNIQN